MKFICEANLLLLLFLFKWALPDALIASEEMTTMRVERPGRYKVHRPPKRPSVGDSTKLRQITFYDRLILTGEKIAWNNSFQTNVSSLAPKAFANKNHTILSVRQIEFDAMNWHSKSYGSGWGFSKLHALVGLKPTMGDFPANCFMNPQVIATLADWAILLPCVYGDISRPPRIVFVHHLMLPHFVRYILPNIPVNHRFVLVSSGSDQTIPTGAGDVRFHPLLGFSSKPEGGPNWKLLTNHPQIIHWFCENHDLAHPNVSTLPVGVVEGVGGMKHVNMTASTVPILERPLKFLVLHRSRNGRGPWVLRAQIQELCLQQQEEHLPSHVLCLSPGRHVQRDTRKGVPLKEYIEFAHNVTFILCVKGGGLDPSPKAWEAIMLGSIPVIQHSTLDDAYQHLPVVFINDWNKLFDSPKLVRLRLQALREKLAPYYSDPVMRAMVLDRLTMSFWEERIESTYRDQRPPPLSVLAVDF